MNKSLPSYEQVMIEVWTSFEQDMKKSKLKKSKLSNVYNLGSSLLLPLK